jgi:hypothetical protein
MGARRARRPAAGMGERGGGGGVAGNCFPDPVEVDGSGREGGRGERSHSVRVAFDLGKVGRERRNAENIPETAAQMPCHSHCQFATLFSFLFFSCSLEQRSNPTRPCVSSFVGLHIGYGILDRENTLRIPSLVCSLHDAQPGSPDTR